MAAHQNQILIGFSSQLFAHGLESIIDSDCNFRVLHSAPMGDKLRHLITNNESFDFLILEVDHPGERDLNYIKQLAETFSSLKILLLSHLPNKYIVSDLLESGISAYLLKSCSRKDLLSALSNMAKDKPFFCSIITKTLIAGYNSACGSKQHMLTEREKEILTRLVQGLTNKSVAKDLKVSENTIKTHRRNIQKKFGVNNLLGMVRYACRENLIDFGCAEFCTTCPYVN